MKTIFGKNVFGDGLVITVTIGHCARPLLLLRTAQVEQYLHFAFAAVCTLVEVIEEKPEEHCVKANPPHETTRVVTFSKH